MPASGFVALNLLAFGKDGAGMVLAGMLLAAMIIGPFVALIGGRKRK